MRLCEACQQKIKKGDAYIKITYTKGKISMHDLFHQSCHENVGIREWQYEPVTISED